MKPDNKNVDPSIVENTKVEESERLRHKQGFWEIFRCILRRLKNWDVAVGVALIVQTLIIILIVFFRNTPLIIPTILGSGLSTTSYLVGSARGPRSKYWKILLLIASLVVSFFGWYVRKELLHCVQ